ncbi:unnamed protein product [Toxocara canis]|uniref:Uncharacterized protein n=1 Tax=Toxocara canis TaxID=6265 RepID=A0A183TVR2_TOXCA|nr:unnamed protein product [Toxocara canis]
MMHRQDPHHDMNKRQCLMARGEKAKPYMRSEAKQHTNTAPPLLAGRCVAESMHAACSTLWRPFTRLD